MHLRGVEGACQKLPGKSCRIQRCCDAAWDGLINTIIVFQMMSHGRRGCGDARRRLADDVLVTADDKCIHDSLMGYRRFSGQGGSVGQRTVSTPGRSWMIQREKT